MTYASEVLADSPAWWARLGEASGTTVNDSSGNGRNGTYAAGGTLGQPSLVATDADTAWLAPSSGAGSASVAYGSWMNAASISIEAWGKSTSSSAGVMVCRDTQSGTRVWQVQRSAAGKVVFTVIAGSIPAATSSASINDGNPHHVVITYDGTTCKIYIDKVLDTTATLSQALPQPTSVGITVGNSARTVLSPFIGTVDEVAVYPGTILTAARVAAHYDAATGAIVSPPAATATAAGAVPVVSAGSSVTSVAATATAAGVVPVVSGSSSVTAVAATATAAAVAPTLSIGATVSPPAATATAAAAAPTVSATGTANVTPPAATATATALPPSLVWDNTVSAVVATAAAAALVPTVSAGATVAAPAATATAVAFAPTVSTVSADATVLAVTATATAAALAPSVAQVWSSGTDTSNVLTGRNRRGRASVTVTRPASSTPSRVAVKYDKSVPYPPPTLVNGRPT